MCRLKSSERGFELDVLELSNGIVHQPLSLSGVYGLAACGVMKELERRACHDAM